MFQFCRDIITAYHMIVTLALGVLPVSDIIVYVAVVFNTALFICMQVMTQLIPS